MDKKRIAILGSTGSVGSQALEVIGKFPEKFQVEVLTANQNFELLIEQAKRFKANAVVIANEEFYKQVDDALWNFGIKTYAGEKALEQVVEMGEIDIVLTAIVGFAGLKATISAINAGKPIALANKESLVVAGEYITKLAAQKRVPILPVDSELSAIFQCLSGEFQNNIEKVFLTASGGPFLDWSPAEMKNISVEDALKHPTYAMGAKISVDSATMINKGFEAIEAKWLFHLTPDQIDIIVHPQSVMHSMVQFEDGTIKAQMGVPDMDKHILFALSYPQRLPLSGVRFDFQKYSTFTFRELDRKKFPNVSLALAAMGKGGNMACSLNAANEVSNHAFRQGQIKFSDIEKVNENVMQKVDFIANASLVDFFETDAQARSLAKSMLKGL